MAHTADNSCHSRHRARAERADLPDTSSGIPGPRTRCAGRRGLLRLLVLVPAGQLAHSSGRGLVCLLLYCIRLLLRPLFSDSAVHPRPPSTAIIAHCAEAASTQRPARPVGSLRSVSVCASTQLPLALGTLHILPLSLPCSHSLALNYRSLVLLLLSRPRPRPRSTHRPQTGYSSGPK